jgi:4a-hydroxytetrahydrobiopterin dehydratase
LTDRITPKQFQDSAGDDWRTLGDGGSAYFRTGSLAAGARLVQAIAELPGVDEHPPDVDVRLDGVTVRLMTITADYGGMTQRDADLARQISAAARKLGLTADPSALQSLLVIPGAPDVAAIMPFWRAVLGYEPRRDSPAEDLVDPRNRGPAFWFERMQHPRPAVDWCATTPPPRGGPSPTRPATRPASRPRRAAPSGHRRAGTPCAARQFWRFVMGKVVIDMSVSLDGYVAGPDDSRAQGLGGNGGEHLHDWLFGGDEPSRHSPFFRPEGRNREVVDELLTTTGVMLTGRRTYDLTDGWGGEHPVPGIAVVVLTHRPPESVPQGPTRFVFCGDGIEAAVRAAQTLAREKTVIVQGASACQQVLRAGLADEVFLHIAPLLLGGGVRLFGEGDHRRLEPLGCFDAPHVIHARYRSIADGRPSA